MADRKTRYINNYQKVCEVIGIEYDESVKQFFAQMESEGHCERSICYAVWRTQENLRYYCGYFFDNLYKNDPNIAGKAFESVLREKIEKFSWKKDDPRWEAYCKRKEEERKASEMLEQISDTANIFIENGKAKITQRYVYFIQGENGGAIKIGLSDDPEKRLKQLQTGYPDVLKILLIIPGNEDTEKTLHKEFKSSRLKGEWFRPDSCVVKKIEELTSKTPLSR